MMKCDICGKVGEHDYRCPYSSISDPKLFCSICGQGILPGEEYIKNPDGEYRHYECFYGLKELLEWLGYEIMTMENTYEKFY